MKRICLILFLTFLTSSALAAPTAEEIFTSFDGKEVFFTDIESYEWAKEAIDYLYKNGMISGVGGGKFAPDLNVTRLEFIKMVCTASAIVDKTAVADYSDVPSSNWGYIYAASAKKAGIADIYGEESLGADTDITREDMAYIAYKAVKLFDESESSYKGEKFADDGEIADYAKEAVYCLKEYGIINGKGENLFEPKGTATRAEAAKIIYNVYKKVSDNYLDK